jgi:hypothetical protein
MQAVFILDASGLVLDEAAAVAALARGEPPTDPLLMGRVHLSDTGLDLALHDDLQFLVPSLCIRAPRRLAAQGEAKVAMASWPQHYLLRRDGETVRVLEGGKTEVARLSYQELTEALAGCAHRFTTYVGGVATLQPSWRPLHALLQRELAA